MFAVAPATLALLMALAGGLPSEASARAEPRVAQPAVQEIRHAVTQAGMSLDDAVQMVQQRFRARVVKAEQRNEDGRTVYHIRLVNNEGKVWTVRVDAQSGAVR